MLGGLGPYHLIRTTFEAWCRALLSFRAEAKLTYTLRKMADSLGRHYGPPFLLSSCLEAWCTVNAQWRTFRSHDWNMNRAKYVVNVCKAGLPFDHITAVALESQHTLTRFSSNTLELSRQRSRFGDTVAATP